MTTYQSTEKAVDAGAEALRPLNRYPWYKADTDNLQQIEVSPRPKQHEFNVSSAMNSWIFWTAVGLLAAFALALVIMMLRAVRRRKASAQNVAEAMAAGEAERIEALPFAVARAKLTLLDQARAFYQAGNYSAAVLYLFSHQLVQLDRRHIIHLAKGKTNRQYLRECGRAEQLRELVGETLVAFEDVFFGHHDLERERFEACWRRLPEFDSLLTKGAPAAARN